MTTHHRRTFIAGGRWSRGDGFRLPKAASFAAILTIFPYAFFCAPFAGPSKPPQAQADGRCGPPHYCARTDRRIEAYPQNPPAWGPAGSIITDPNFGSRILRVTDTSANPQRPGAPYHSASSAEQNTWNRTTTRFYVGDSGGLYYLYDFDPSTMAPHPAGKLQVQWRGEPQFSYAQPNILYGISGRPPQFQQYDTSNGRLTTIHDPASCLRAKPADIGASMSVSADDSRMMAIWGPQQNADYLVYLYDRARGCRWYNTETGEVGGQWGPTGTIPNPARFTIHDARLSKSGEYVELTVAGGYHRGPTFWQTDTLNVTECAHGPLFQCTGHHVMGYTHFLNSANSVHPLDFVVRPLNDLKSMTHLIYPLPLVVGWYDYHVSWSYANPQDTTPACFSTYRPGNSGAPGVPLEVTGPWENEVDCVETDAKAPAIWRFAHTYSTAKNGFWSTPRGNVSQDGRFYMFTSDWEDQLGRDPDPKASRYRTDVFIVELR